MISIPVIFSLRATHGAHTVNFAPWDKGDSGDYINKTTWVAYKIMKSTSMDSTRLQSSWSHKDHTMGERDKPHSYRYEPSPPMKNYSLLIMGGSKDDDGGGGVDGDGSGGNSPSRQGAGTGPSDPRNGVSWRRSTEMYSGVSSIVLGFTPRGE